MIQINTLSQNISYSVKNFYEKYPYPHYPLWFRPRWQDGYLGSSLFAAKLLYNNKSIYSATYLTDKKMFLSIGCGEILPFIIRKIEPYNHIIICVDLSEHSLRRAKFRLIGNFAPIKFFSQDINDFLIWSFKEKCFYIHVDAYGVLHHLADPLNTLNLLQNVLLQNSTIRVMVYNTYARAWIRHFNKIFSLLQINPYDTKELNFILKLLDLIYALSGSLANKLKRTGYDNILKSNPTILVDTFLHPWEINFSFTKWVECLKNSGFEIFAMFDRYGELDDINNPLWEYPPINELDNRIHDKRFEANFELYLYKAQNKIDNTNTHENLSKLKSNILQKFKYLLKTPPYLWFTFNETKNIPYYDRWILWKLFVNYIFFNEKKYIDNFIVSTLGINAAKRLARVGAIFKDQILSTNLQQELLSPLVTKIEADEDLPKIDFFKTQIPDILKNYMYSKNIFSSKRLELILHRLNKAQN